MAYPSEYYTKAQEIIDKRRFENSVKAEKRLREVRSKIPEIVEIDSKLSKTIDELVKIILSDKPDKKQRIEQVLHLCAARCHLLFHRHRCGQY